MINELSEKISRQIICEGIRPEGDVEKLAYGFRKIFNYIIQVLVLAVIALISGLVLNMLVYTVFYCSLRTRVGGAHSKSRIGCIATFTVLATAAIAISAHIPGTFLRPISAATSVFSFVTVFILAPVTHPNAPASKATLAKCKTQGRIIVSAECAVVLLLCLIAPTAFLPYVLCAALGMGIVSVFLLIPMINRKKGGSE